jgi:cytochrome b561
MRFRNSADGYGAVAQSLHWLTVSLVAIAWALGTFDDVLPKGAARAAGLFIHISAGMAILVALVARTLWRMADPPPQPAPTMLEVWAETAARLGHYALAPARLFFFIVFSCPSRAVSASRATVSSLAKLSATGAQVLIFHRALVRAATR